MVAPTTVPLSLRRYGEHSPDDSPIVFLHGLLGSGSNWHTHAQWLSETRRVLSPDLRNHGRSAHSADVSYGAMAADVLAMLTEESIERATLVGHSMGGKVAMIAALLEPDRVERLVVVDIAPVSYPNRYERVFDALQSLDLGSLTSRREADERLMVQIPDIGMRQFLLQNLVKEAQGWAWRVNLTVLAEMAEVLMGFEGPETAGPYNGPSLVIHGAESDYVRDSHIEAFRRHFPQVVFERIEGAGHWVHAEQPQRFMDVLLRFF